MRKTYGYLELRQAATEQYMTYEGTDRLPKGTPIGKLLSERCPKCHGSMAVELDAKAGYYKLCLNCGYVGYLRDVALQWNWYDRRWEPQ